jgi:hypothetical protein
MNDHGRDKTAYKMSEYNSTYRSYRGIQIPLDTVLRSVVLLSSLLSTTYTVGRAPLMKLTKVFNCACHNLSQQVTNQN